LEWGFVPIFATKKSSPAEHAMISAEGTGAEYASVFMKALRSVSYSFMEGMNNLPYPFHKAGYSPMFRGRQIDTPLYGCKKKIAVAPAGHCASGFVRLCCAASSLESRDENRKTRMKNHPARMSPSGFCAGGRTFGRGYCLASQEKLSEGF
jgi:hypothetical protein